jgi:hypothetical protein
VSLPPLGQFSLFRCNRLGRSAGDDLAGLQATRSLTDAVAGTKPPLTGGVN